MQPNATQTLIIWALLARGGQSFAKDLKPEVKKADRAALTNAGLITCEKGPRGALKLEVTDKGWDWASRHLGADLPKASTAGVSILQAWLIRLSQYMQTSGVSLANILAPPEPIAWKNNNDSAHLRKPQNSHTTLRERIRAAYRDVTGGPMNRRALLSDVRTRLSDVDRPVLDEALREMHSAKEIVLMRLDNPREVTAEVSSAALTLSGETMHILWIKQ